MGTKEKIVFFTNLRDKLKTYYPLTFVQEIQTLDKVISDYKYSEDVAESIAESLAECV